MPLRIGRIGRFPDLSLPWANDWDPDFVSGNGVRACRVAVFRCRLMLGTAEPSHDIFLTKLLHLHDNRACLLCQHHCAMKHLLAPPLRLAVLLPWFSLLTPGLFAAAAMAPVATGASSSITSSSPVSPGPETAKPDGRQDLITFVGNGSEIHRHIFANGKHTGPEAIITAPIFRIGRSSFVQDAPIWQNRYLLSRAGDAVDLLTGQLQERRTATTAYNILLATPTEVVLKDGRNTGLYRLTDPMAAGVENLPAGRYPFPAQLGSDFLSPDNTRLAVFSSGSLRVSDSRTAKDHVFPGDFALDRSPASSEAPPGSPTSHLDWLDNERLLVCRGAGEILLLAMDGTQRSLGTIPGYVPALSSPTYRHDAKNRVFVFSNAAAALIDVAGGQVVPADVFDLGHGWDIQFFYAGNPWVLRHDGQQIDRLGQGFMPLVSPDGQEVATTLSRPNRVYSLTSGAWVDLPANETILGWMSR